MGAPLSGRCHALLRASFLLSLLLHSLVSSAPLHKPSTWTEVITKAILWWLTFLLLLKYAQKKPPASREAQNLSSKCTAAGTWFWAGNHMKCAQAPWGWNMPTRHTWCAKFARTSRQRVSAGGEHAKLASLGRSPISSLPLQGTMKRRFGLLHMLDAQLPGWMVPGLPPSQRWHYDRWFDQPDVW